jgi:thiamine pyrophosphate-dependent acetolactate synthase large subunit-like protein
MKSDSVPRSPRTGDHIVTSTSAVERPAAAPANAVEFGSDVVAATLRALDIPFIALNPGASFRGLHDSLVNFLGNERPQMLLCLHEEHAVAIAHGYAKVTGRAMAAAVHANVGLFHATMAIFNAWCDRMPVLVIGATGPVDAPKRRPWIDWIHTARDQGALVRAYVKWDDQPASPEAAREAVMRACWLAQTAPMGPVYINLDAGMQEARLAEPLPPLDAARFVPAVTTAAPPELLAQAAQRLNGAERPVLMIGRVSRDHEAWQDRITLAETLAARVLTDLKVGAAFPTDHPLHVGAPSLLLGSEAAEALRTADVILSLDWVDLAGTLKTAFGGTPSAAIVHVSLDHALHHGWSMDYQGLPPVDLFLPAEPDAVVPSLLEALEPDSRTTSRASESPPSRPGAEQLGSRPPASTDIRIGVDDMATALRQAVGHRAASLLHLPLSWNGATWPFRHPLDYIGSAGGGGLGAGPGIAVGAALALKGSGRLPIAVCGDGDFLMGATALWTAAHYRIPLMVVVGNNRSFYNDEVHQERVARMRNRPVENKWIGQRIADPDIDIAALARAQGATGIGPIARRADLAGACAEAIAAVDRGAVAVVDVRVEPGYTPAMTAALTRSAK